MLPRGLTAHSVLLAPLLVRGRALGVLTLGIESPTRRFDADTLAMVAELATRAATAVDNALLFRKIQDEDQRKNEFLAMLAHELRNPLAPISNAVHIIRVSADEPAKIAWARDVIARQLKQLVRLVDDLLDVSRITRGKIELKIDVVDVQQVVEAAIETSKPNIDGHRHTLSIQLPAETLHLRGDFARVSQILVEPDQQRGQVHAARRPDLAVRCPRRRCESSSASAIPVSAFRRNTSSTIFEPFTQVDRSLARSHGGLGIGLTLVRRLVEMQGGTVVARSEGRNRGSEFTVRLPLAALVPARCGCQHVARTAFAGRTARARRR